MFRCFEVISEIEDFLIRLGSYVVNSSLMYNFLVLTHILRFVFTRGESFSSVLLKGEFTFLNHEFLNTNSYNNEDQGGYFAKNILIKEDP